MNKIYAQNKQDRMYVNNVKIMNKIDFQNNQDKLHINYVKIGSTSSGKTSVLFNEIYTLKTEVANLVHQEEVLKRQIIRLEDEITDLNKQKNYKHNNENLFTDSDAWLSKVTLEVAQAKLKLREFDLNNKMVVLNEQIEQSGLEFVETMDDFFFMN